MSDDMSENGKVRKGVKKIKMKGGESTPERLNLLAYCVVNFLTLSIAPKIWVVFSRSRGVPRVFLGVRGEAECP